MTESTPIKLDVETRLPGGTWQKSTTITMYDNGKITGFTKQGSSIGDINFDSYMGPEAIKKCRKPSMFGSLKRTFDRVNRYDFIKDGKVVLSINFYFPTGKEDSFNQKLSKFTKVSACLSGGRKRKSRKAKKTRKRKNTRRKTRKRKAKKTKKRGGGDDMCKNYKDKLDGIPHYANRDDVTLEAGDKYCDIMFPIDKGHVKHKCNKTIGKCTELDELGMPITPVSVGGRKKRKKGKKSRKSKKSRKAKKSRRTRR